MSAVENPSPGDRTLLRRPTLTERLGMGRLQVATRIGEIDAGIVSTAGIVEGFSGAGLGGAAVVLAALSALIAGAVATGGAKYAEQAGELEAQDAALAELERLLQLSPEEELAELTEVYRAKGLSPSLARAVADELTATDAVAAHAEVEYGISTVATRPLVVALGAGLSFMVGAAFPLAIVWFTPLTLHGLITYVAVLFSLMVTAVLGARLGRSSLRRGLGRSLLVGVLTLSAAWIAGRAFIT